MGLQNVLTQIPIADDLIEFIFNECRVDRHHLLLHNIGHVIEHLLEKCCKDRVQATRADIFNGLIHYECNASDGRDRIWLELNRDPFRLEQSRILLEKCVLRDREDLHEVLLGEAFEFDAYWESPLKLWNEIARLRN